MNQYVVDIPVNILFACQIDADSEEEAIKKAVKFFNEEDGRFEKGYYNCCYSSINPEKDIVAEEV